MPKRTTQKNCKQAIKKMTKTYYTLKQFYKEEKELEQQGATSAQISKHRKIWDLASRGWTLSKVGTKRTTAARSLLWWVHREWKCKDNALEWDQWDNDHARRRRQYWDHKDDEALEKIEKLCKVLGLALECSTFAHIVAETPNGRREIL